MDEFVDELTSNWGGLLAVPISAVAMLLATVLIVRVIGLRSFSKMSSFDFAVTVSIGSILGGVVASSTPLVNGIVAAVSLLGAQAAVSLLRSRRERARAVLDNTPIVLMDGPRMLNENLAAVRVSRSDVIAKLREANVLRLEDVRAVVLETTGDISVLHGSSAVDPELLDDVRPGPAGEFNCAMPH